MKHREDIADELLIKFISWKVKIQPYYKATPFDKKNMLKAADNCIVSQIPSHHYFYAQVMDFDDKGIEKCGSKHFCGPAALQRAEQYMATAFTLPKPEDVFYVCAKNFSLLVNMNPAPIQILLSDKNDFPAWFRMLATTHDNAEIAKLYREQAITELRLDPRIEEFITSQPLLAKNLSRIKDGRRN